MVIKIIQILIYIFFCNEFINVMVYKACMKISIKQLDIYIIIINFLNITNFYSVIENIKHKIIEIVQLHKNGDWYCSLFFSGVTRSRWEERYLILFKLLDKSKESSYSSWMLLAQNVWEKGIISFVSIPVSKYFYHEIQEFERKIWNSLLPVSALMIGSWKNLCILRMPK